MASAALATTVQFWGWAGVGGDSHDACLADTENGCFGGRLAFSRFLFSEAGPAGLAYLGFEPGGDTFDLSFDFDVRYTLFDVFASNGLITAEHHPYPGPYNDQELGEAGGHIVWTAKPIEIKPGPMGYHEMEVHLPIVLSGYLKAWTAEEWVSGEAPFFGYQVTGTGTLNARAPYSPFYWNSGYVTFSGSAEPIPEPATWALALTFGLLTIWRIVASGYDRGSALLKFPRWFVAGKRP
jgi:hypothetical protein